MKSYKLLTVLLAIAALIAMTFSSCKKDSTKPRPTAKYTPSTTSTELGTSITFTNQSTNASYYLWKFGDGNGSVEDNPSYTYDSIGTFKVTLIALGTGGSDSTSTTISVISNNITIYDGKGIKEMSIGASWSTIKNNFGTDTSYSKYYYQDYQEYQHLVWYPELGMVYDFISTSSVLSSTDKVTLIAAVNPYEGTSEKGIAIRSPRANVLAYYGTPTNTTSDSSYVEYDYSTTGISFVADLIFNEVVEIDVYLPHSPTSKAAESVPVGKLHGIKK